MLQTVVMEAKEDCRRRVRPNQGDDSQAHFAILQAAKPADRTPGSANIIVLTSSSPLDAGDLRVDHGARFSAQDRA